MFLRLSSVVAMGRALCALAVVAASMTGHAATGHHHLDVSRAALAFLMLLAAAWSTNNPRTLLIAALAAQLIVHGAAPMQGTTMVLVHGCGALAALVITARFELLWSACSAALVPLLRVTRALVLPVVPGCATAQPRTGEHRFVAFVYATTAPRRGPPAFV